MWMALPITTCHTGRSAGSHSESNDFFFNIKVGDFNSRNHLTYPNDWLRYKLTYSEMVSSIHVSFFLTVNDLIGTYQKHLDT